MADFCNFFLQNVMAANIIENFKNFEIFLLSQGGKKNFFLTHLGKSKNFKIFKIFNNIGSHDVLKKKITKIGQNAANPSFF